METTESTDFKKTKIINAINELVAKGIEIPTNNQVRDQLGGGSLSDISPVLKEWRTGRKQEIASANIEIPVELKKSYETFIGQIWSVASNLSHVAVDALRNEMNETITTITEERDEYFEEIKSLEKTISNQAIRFTSLEKEVLLLSTANAAYDKDVTFLTQSKTELENNAIKLNSKIDSLGSQLVSANDQLSDYSQKLDTANSKSLAYETEIKYLKSLIEDKKEIILKANTDTQSLKDQIKADADRYVTLQTSLVTVETQNSSLLKEIENLNTLLQEKNIENQKLLDSLLSIKLDSDKQLKGIGGLNDKEHK